MTSECHHGHSSDWSTDAILLLCAFPKNMKLSRNPTCHYCTLQKSTMNASITKALRNFVIKFKCVTRQFLINFLTRDISRMWKMWD